MYKFKALLLLCLIVVFVACGGTNDEAVIDDGFTGGDALHADVPLLWHVTSPAGHTMYLFGSMHVADASIYPLPSFIMEAFERSDYLAVEINVIDPPEPADLIALGNMMVVTGGSSIIDYIGYELHERAQALLNYHQPEGWLPAFADSFAPVVWWMSLQEIVTTAAGLTPEYGIDMYFMNLASERDMPIIEAESLLFQMSMLSNFSHELQLALIENAIEAAEDLDESVYYMRAMLDAWATGDYSWILELANYEYDGFDAELLYEFNRGMLINRDIDMALVARDLMTDEKQVFFMVGLLHFLHEDSIIANLERAGYTVVRVLE